MRRLLVIVFLLLSSLAYSQQKAVDYTQWAQVLKKYIDDNGRVNYALLKENTEDLDQFIAVVENTDIDSLSDQGKKAFWINAYNAVTLKVVRDKYPVRSIRHINFGLVWEIKRNVAKGKYSLGHIEHKIVRPLGDPRIHFALNCASIGCPKLPQKPFYEETLDEQLDVVTREFINNPEKVRLDRANNTLYYSAIFDWFEEDFLKIAPDILNYIKKYINEEDRIYLEKNTVKMNVLKYDWGLNKQNEN